MALLLLPLILLLIITLFFTTSYHYFHRFRYNLPPGPRPLPFVGNVYDLKPVLVRCFSEWANTYGPIFSVYLGSQLNVVVSSPELAKQVLEDNDEKLGNRNRTDMINKISNYGADMIWADYGPHYVKLRKLCTLELFTAKRVEALRPIREDEVTAMVESIYNDYCTSILQPAEKKGKPILLRKYLAMMTFLHITRLTFGKRFIDSNGILDKQGQQLKSILDDNVTSGGKIKSYFGFIPGYNYMFKDEVNELDHRIKRSIDFTKVIMEEQTRSRHNTGNTKSHFVDAMLTLQEEYQLSEDNITGLLWDMIAAGMETTSISIEWSMAEMVRNPRVQKKVQEELDRVVGPNRVMTEADIPNLPYLQCVVKECFRMHIPTPLMLPHKANDDVKMGGYDVPKGATVEVNAWAIGRDPSVWKDPLEFRPERFEEEDVDMKGSDFRLITFGSGRRVCPGAKLGTNLVTSSLGHLLHSFTWTPPPGMNADMMERPGQVTYMRTTIEAVPTPRLDSPDLFKRVATGTI